MSLSISESSDLFRRDPNRWIDVGAGEVALRTVGSGPDVLFVHGWPVSGATFRAMLPHLVDHVTCHVIDLPSAGSSRFTADTPMSIGRHIESVRRVIDDLGVDRISVVGHDSGGLISRHAVVDDERLVGLGLINTEPVKPGWRFTSFITASKAPGFGATFGWVCGQPKVRRTKLALGDAFVDPANLDGEFDEFFLRPLHTNDAMREAAVQLARSFDLQFCADLATIHPRITAPVAMVWGDLDPFFPVEQAREMVKEFPNATLAEIRDAGLFCHEERPAEVAEALLPVLTVS